MKQEEAAAEAGAAGHQAGNAVPAGDGDEGINGRGSEVATGRLGYLLTTLKEMHACPGRQGGSEGAQPQRANLEGGRASRAACACAGGSSAFAE